MFAAPAWLTFFEGSHSDFKSRFAGAAANRSGFARSTSCARRRGENPAKGVKWFPIAPAVSHAPLLFCEGAETPGGRNTFTAAPDEPAGRTGPRQSQDRTGLD